MKKLILFLTIIAMVSLLSISFAKKIETPFGSFDDGSPEGVEPTITTKKTLTSIAITVDEPEAGKVLPTAIKTLYSTNTSTTSYNIGQTYDIFEARWDSTDETVQAGSEYKLTVIIKGLDQYNISDGFRTSINGNDVEHPGLGGQIIMNYTFKIATGRATRPTTGVVATRPTTGTITLSSGDKLSSGTGATVSQELIDAILEKMEKSGEIMKLSSGEYIPVDRPSVVLPGRLPGVTLAKSGDSKEESTDAKESSKAEEPAKTEEPVKTEEPAKAEEKVEKIVWTSASSWALEELSKANEAGLIPTIFNKEDLTKNITRKEFAYVAVKLYEKIAGKKATAPSKNPFTDTKDTEVLKAYAIGITTGVSETEFAPDREITREQMATMMQRALSEAGIDTKVDLAKVKEFTDDSEMHNWSRTAIYFMSEAGIIKGVSTTENRYGVKGTATREQALLISYRSVDRFSR